MGSCVSLSKDPDSAVGFRWRATTPAGKGGKLYAAPSPAKQPGVGNGGSKVDALPLNGNDGEPGFGFHKNIDFGSKEEDFFDTKGYMDSDCEDDFYSVRGDFTPSRGNTPVHEKSGIPVTPRLNKTMIDVFPDTRSSEPSPRKKLAELLQEDVVPEANGDEAVAGNPETNGVSGVASPNNTDQPSKSVSGTPYQSGVISVSSGARTPSGELCNGGKVKTGKTMQCCLPSIVPSFSSAEKKKAEQSPGI